MKTLILGLGNPILSDDAAGLHIARLLHGCLGGEDVDLVEAAVAGLQTVELLSRYDRAVVIDVVQDEARAGEWCRLDPHDLEGGSSISSHSIGLGQALRLARLLGLPLPAQTLVYAVAVADPYTFGERLSPRIEQALPSIVRQIAADLSHLWGQG
ncbi:MAG: hydrogenase maturation protease [Chloroflexota bacterium]|nr:hydrogenase maturation protease [Chloroflexota bacterium]